MMELLNRRLRLIHFSMLTTQHMLMGSLMPRMDAYRELAQTDKDIKSGTTSFEPRPGNPFFDKEFHYGLPTSEELREKSGRQLEEYLRKSADPLFGAVREDPDDENSRITHWMPTDTRWLHMTLIQNEINRRSERNYRILTLSLALLAIGISVAAFVASTLVTPGVPSTKQ